MRFDTHFSEKLSILYELFSSSCCFFIVTFNNKQMSILLSNIDCLIDCIDVDILFCILYFVYNKSSIANTQNNLTLFNLVEKMSTPMLQHE